VNARQAGSGTLRTGVRETVDAARFLWRLPGYYREPIRPDEARRIVRHRLDHREADFLTLARRAIYGHAPSPYRELLRVAGCEEGDLIRLVGREGVDGALRTLCRHGVYLTVDEFKGQRPAVRGRATIRVDPGGLRNPLAAFHLASQTSGSRGVSRHVPVDLECIRDRAVNTGLTLDARGGSDWVKGIWGMSTGALGLAIRFSGFGAPTARCFVLVDPATRGLPWRYRWSARLLRATSATCGLPLPRAEHVPLDEPGPILRWMTEVLRAGRTPHLWTFVSPAVRLCQAALAAGLDIGGAQFTVTGEPVTAARLAVIHQAGAEAMVDYGSAETGFLAHGCLAPRHPDEVHLFQDLHALVQVGPGEVGAGLPAGTLLVSSLRASAPLICLNVSMGDRARVGPRPCDCPLERLGWTTHLHGIQSFEKLTAGGMTFLDTQLIRVLEEVLPVRFGGGPTDYQLLEEEGDDGAPSVRLLVHPSIGPLDPSAVAHVFLTAIGEGPGAERGMALHWQAARLLRVERRPPIATATGKILHLHQRQPARVPVSG
jgi:hypothetical protein